MVPTQPTDHPRIYRLSRPLLPLLLLLRPDITALGVKHQFTQYLLTLLLSSSSPFLFLFIIPLYRNLQTPQKVQQNLRGTSFFYGDVVACCSVSASVVIL